MRPITKYKKGTKMQDCIFLEEKESIVIQFKGKNKTKFTKRIGIFKCYCGKEFESAIVYIKNGTVKSCGCLRDKKIKAQGYKNKIHNLRSHPLYSVWKSMIYRCENINDMNYFRYGARGIKVSKEWHNINTFVKDMEKSYLKGLQLDRINNDGNYSKDNCRWVTRKVNANNTRRNRYVIYKGVKKTVGEWSEYTDIPYATLINRLNSWDVEKVFTTPFNKRNYNKPQPGGWLNKYSR